MKTIILTNEYKKQNKALLEEMKEWKESSFETVVPEITAALQQYQEAFEKMMETANEIGDELNTNIAGNDLRYQIVNSILLTRDLQQFYKEGLKERFLLRIENYEQRERVNRLFK